MNMDGPLQKTFGDYITSSSWPSLKAILLPGTQVSGIVVHRTVFAVILDIGKGFPAILLATRFCPSLDRPEDLPILGESVTATVHHFADEDRQIVLTQENAMRQILADTVAVIADERPAFSRSFDLVQQLVQDYGENNLAQRLAEEIPETVPWEIVADLFSILVWSTSDNGTALCRTTENWLRKADNLWRIRIALDIDVYPFLDRVEMEDVLTRVAELYPAVSDECEKLIKSRQLS
jgi:hypothetical protein